VLHDEQDVDSLQVGIQKTRANNFFYLVNFEYKTFFILVLTYLVEQFFNSG